MRECKPSLSIVELQTWRHISKPKGEASPAESSVVGGAKLGTQSIAIYRKYPRRREGGGACAPVISRGLAGDDVMQCSPRSLISSAGFSAVHTDHSSGVAAPSEILPPVLNIHAVLSGLRRPRAPSPSTRSRNPPAER